MPLDHQGDSGMMLVSTLFGSLFTGGAAAGAAAGAGAVASTGMGSLGMTLLQGVGTAFTALSAISAGKAQADQLKVQAQEEKFKAQDEKIKGEQNAAKLNKELALTLQRQQVAFAAAGVDLSSQAVEASAAQATKDAERELDYNVYDTIRTSQAHFRQARNLRISAKNAVAQGYMNAFGEIVGFGQDVLARG
jgi:hypothetical protein